MVKFFNISKHHFLLISWLNLRQKSITKVDLNALQTIGLKLINFICDFICIFVFCFFNFDFVIIAVGLTNCHPGIIGKLHFFNRCNRFRFQWIFFCVQIFFNYFNFHVLSFVFWLNNFFCESIKDFLVNIIHIVFMLILGIQRLSCL